MSIYDLNAYEVLQTEDLSDLKSKDSVHHRQTVQEFHTLWNILFCADRKNSR